MTRNRLIAIFVVFAALTSACSKGVNYVGDNCKPGDKKCEALYKIKSPTPTPTKTATTKPKPSATPTKASVKPTPQGYQGKTYTLTIKDTSGYKPDQQSVYQGDYLVIKNADSGDHQWQVYKQDNLDKVIQSSPVLAPGKSWKWKVDIAPGTYLFRDGKVPYIQSGHFSVAPEPK